MLTIDIEEYDFLIDDIILLETFEINRFGDTLNRSTILKLIICHALGCEPYDVIEHEYSRLDVDMTMLEKFMFRVHACKDMGYAYRLSRHIFKDVIEPFSIKVDYEHECISY